MGKDIITSVLTLLGVIISLKWSTGNAKKNMEQSLKLFESELTRKVYASSKRADLEYEIFLALNQCCSEILLFMQLLYADKPYIHITQNKEETELKGIAVKIRDFELLILKSQAFIPDDIIDSYSELLSDSEQFIASAERHILCWNENKSDYIKKTDLRNEAYEKRKRFEEKWTKVNARIKEYLLSAF